ncbi:MAG: BLUF domain-containing protein [Rhodospirillales bacterium]|jgi:hypothetical protein|nr:BLUF domain-containing protein [Rhodospirillales bacterium]
MKDATLHRVVYVSRSRIAPQMMRGELDQILAQAQAANLGSRVTGALLFSRTGFAQVLEGPLAAVAETFERIQRDPRHGDVVVLESGSVAERVFPDWSMALAGDLPETEADLPRDQAGAARVLTLLRDLVQQTAEAAP